ncbi:hypothetical protein BM43_4951 [Burkholderia gladioli]|uniref:Uncharacterized protein n=1 Tax=Burkholderia gladioli TaxID=28095 RepID=A0AAW3EZE9_BURGA|nr:hypothetical protein BM43_4951 [Burkholderia gladioli]KGC13923.1 hypothetical protein DM48_2815 [Burkholderia gladioli]
MTQSGKSRLSRSTQGERSRDLLKTSGAARSMMVIPLMTAMESH